MDAKHGSCPCNALQYKVPLKFKQAPKLLEITPISATERDIKPTQDSFDNALLSGSQGLEEVLQIADFAALGLLALVKCSMAEVQDK